MPKTRLSTTRKAKTSTDTGAARSPASLAIATPQAAATEAGAAAFEAGGNALDAAIAAALSLAVIYPDNCALGGDLIGIVRLADGSCQVVNSSGPAAAAVEADRLLGGEPIAIRGTDPMTVPGLVAGLEAISQLGGRRPWEALFDAAIERADRGFEVPPTLAASIAREAADLERDDGCRQTFFDSGSPLAAGYLLRQPALAETLRRIAFDGATSLYGGPVGAELVAYLAAQGSPLALGDLAGFEPAIEEPLLAPLGEGRTVLTAGPNSQGFILPLSLHALARHDLGADPLGAGAGVLARIFAAALEIRESSLCDPRDGDDLAEWVLAEETVEGVAAGADPAPARLHGSGDTVAIVSADDAGNSVSMLQSLYHPFGAAMLDPGTGIALHNRGAGFSTDPASPNAIAAGRRPAHTLAPSMVLERGRPAVVLSTMGGSSQPQLLAEILLRLGAGAGAESALAAPRWAVGGLGAGDGLEQILVEPGLAAAARDALAATGSPLEEVEELGHAQLIVSAGGGFEAASDPRSEGAALVVERS